MIELTPLERRVLAYLDQKGPTHRANMVTDLVSDESRTAYRNRKRYGSGGSNGAVPLIAGKWTKRLLTHGFLRDVRCRDFIHRAFEVTPAGRAALRLTETRRST